VGVGRATLGRAARAACSSPGAGALTLAALFLSDFAGMSVQFMGVSDPEATRYLIRRYGPHIAAQQMKILLVYLLVGAAMGVAGACARRAWESARRLSPSTLRRAAFGAGAALIGHGFFLTRSIVRYPQLYTEALYDRGGWRRSLMVALTEHISVASVDVLGATLVVAGLLALGLAPVNREWLCTRWPQRRPSVPGARLVAALAGTGALLLFGLALRRQPAPHPERPNVLLVAVDSLRADRVFVPDAGKRFPALSGLARRGVRFLDAHVTVPRTFPSFVTLLTGRYPHHHGIRHMFPTAAARRAIGPTLPAALRDHGYETAVVADYAGEIFSRTPLGFSDVDVPSFDMETILDQRGLQVHPNALPYATSRAAHRLFPAVDALPERSDPSLLADRAIDELHRLDGRPFFLTVFFSAPHFPYAAPAPFYRRFAAATYEGPFRYEKPPLGAPPASPADVAQIRALYDGAVAATDAALARLLDALDASGRASDTIVVLLADHGENLYDLPGRGMGHGDHLEGSAADHVPLIVVDPAHHLPPHDVAGLVRDVDVAPTLAALLRVPGPPGDGIDLAPLLRGERATLDLEGYAETELWFTTEGPGFGPDQRLPYPGVTGVTEVADDNDIQLKTEWQDLVVVAKHRALRTDRWKLVYRPTRGGALWTLFDLSQDPDEREDVLARFPDVAATLQLRLRRWIAADEHMIWHGGFAVTK
jgi:arylsulfatase A-like enzyme